MVLERHSSVSVKKRFFRWRVLPCLKDYLEDLSFTGDSSELWRQVYRGFANDKFSPRERTENSFVLVTNDRAKPSMLDLANVFRLLRLNTQDNRGRNEYIFLQYMECTATLHEVDAELGSVVLRWGTMDGTYQKTVAGEELNLRTKLYIGEWFEVERIKAIWGLVQVWRSSYGILPPSSALPPPYHCFYV